MELAGWDAKYREAAPRETGPSRLLLEFATSLPPGRALELACGLGQNSFWLAQRGWKVMALDGAPSAIRRIHQQQEANGISTIDARVLDLSNDCVPAEAGAFDLVLDFYYLQRDLFPQMKQLVKPSGLVLAVVHTTQGNEAPTKHRLRPGELASYFDGWQIIHSHEGPSRDPAHRRAVAEIAARPPGTR